MKHISLIIFIMFFSAGTSAKAILYTPPLSPSSSTSFYCQIANINKSSKKVILEIYNGNGELVRNSTVLILPNSIKAISGSDTDSQFCKFTVVDGKKSDVRGSATLYTTAGDQSDLVALPAQ
ncbi:hypothetical protein [Methylomonas rhizoryzae]|uniref:hypothetical protein n=1 Tax=Methylomonas rhizoryzae TaxID=2608981 RepID=UPI001232E516|nr:hypothetical protein [Methylomonas rhizoryzae]